MKTVSAVCVVVMLLCAPLLGSAQGSARQAITVENAGQLVEIIRLGRGSAEHVAFTPDGQTIAVAGTVGVWLYPASALDTQTEPPLLKSNGVVTAMTFSPDGAALATASDSAIQYWDVASQTLTNAIDLKTTSHALAFSPDGTLLAINTGSKGIALLDVATGVEQAELTGNIQSDAAIAFSPDGTLIAGSTTDYKVHLWRVADASEAAVLSGHSRYVYDFAFSPDGATLASASYDETVRLWDVAGGSELAALAGTEAQPLGEAFSVAFSPGGALLASGHADGVVALWDVASRALQAVVGPQAGNMLDLAFSPDGARLASVSSNQAVQLWDVAAGAEVMAAVGHTNYMNAAVFSPDSATLAVAEWDEHVWLWDTASRQELHLAPSVVDVLATAAKDVTWLAYASDGSLLATSDGYDVILLDPATGAEVRKLGGCNGITVSFAFSPDDTLLAFATSDGMCVFNVETGEVLASFASGDWLNSATFSPDQTLIAAAGKDHTVRVYGLP